MQSMRIEFNKVTAVYTIEWALPIAPLPGDAFRDIEGDTYTVLSTDGANVTLAGPRFPKEWLEPVKEDWVRRTFEHRLYDLWSSVECLDFAVSGATVPNEFVLRGLSGNMVLLDRPVSFLPQASIASVHILVEPVPGVHGDFMGADLKGKPLDRFDLTIGKKGRISVIGNQIEIDTKVVKTSMWGGDFQHAVCKATQMAYAVLEDKQLVIEHRLGPSAG